MPVIGLTGGIAAGKSTVSAFLKHKGAFLVDADQLSREVVAPGTAGLRAVAAAFPGVLKEDGSLDRKALGERVFSDEAARLRLNGLLHPLIIEETKARLNGFFSADPGGVAVVDAALLLEAGMDSLCDEIWVVFSRDDVRLSRLMARDGLTKAQALARMRSQPPQEETVRRADRVIDDSGAPEKTLRQAEEALFAFRARFCARE